MFTIFHYKREQKNQKNKITKKKQKKNGGR